MAAPDRHIVTCEDTRGFVEAGCGLIAATLLRAVRQRGTASIALAGGSTPLALYEALAQLAMPWDRIDVFWSDERAVPPDHEHSNAGAAGRTLLDPAGVPPHRIHRPHAEADDLDAAARHYERTLRETLAPDAGNPDEAPRLDLVLLGMGADGHTASLLPGSDALDAGHRLVVATSGGDPIDRRLTLTYPAINAAQTILVMVRGEAKATLVRTVLHGATQPSEHPIAGVGPRSGEMYWLLDAEAASRL